ncbi:hypothetical protein Tco_0659496, partial [Tanacetum coccineum]
MSDRLLQVSVCPYVLLRSPLHTV